ncbi:MAG TPA: hypothetical protein VHD87_12755 [Acidimicrobiales bacterium]|nr:hypothetical protein [Acidimicrobiales bacterium]
MPAAPCEALTSAGEVCWRATTHPTRRCSSHRLHPLRANAPLTASTSPPVAAATLALRLAAYFPGVAFDTTIRFEDRPVVLWVDGPPPADVSAALVALTGSPVTDVGGMLVDPSYRVVCTYVRRHSEATLAAALAAQIKVTPPPRAAHNETLASWAGRVARAVLRDLYPTASPELALPITPGVRRLAAAPPSLEHRSTLAWLVAHAKAVALGKVSR